MKNKTIMYDDIVTASNGENFNHGNVGYEEYIGVNGEKLYTTQVDLKLAISQNKSDDFIKDLTELVGKYSL